MSDISQGEGWWQASDLKWYPPEQHPDYQPPVEAPAPTSAAEQPPPVVEPVQPTPVVEPVQPTPVVEPVQPPPVEPAREPFAFPQTPIPEMGPAPSSGSNTTKWIVVGVLAFAVVALAAFLLLGGGSSKKDDAGSSSNSTSDTGSSASSTTNSSTSSSSVAPITAAELQARMLSAKDVGPGFKDGVFAVDDTTPTQCGQQNPNQVVPPQLDVGSQATDSSTAAFFREEVSDYKDAATAGRAFDLSTQGLTCTHPTLKDGTAIKVSAPKEVSSTFGTKVVSFDFQVGTITGQFFEALTDNRIVTLQLNAPSNADPSTLPDPTAVLKQVLTKLNP